MSKEKQTSTQITAKGKNVIGAINASGESTVNIQQEYSQSNQNDKILDELFTLLEEKIATRPEDPDVDKAELEAQVQNIQAEVVKGEEANQAKLERWIRYLGSMAPDILDVIVASLAGPVSGFAAALKKIVDKVQAESQKSTD